MTVHETNFLRKSQAYHKAIFDTPKGALTRWGVNKIDYYYENESIKIDADWAAAARKLLVVAMPIFAVLDTMKFLAKAFFNAAILRPRTASYDLLRCGKSLQLFLCALPATIVAISSPRLVYRSERYWGKKMCTRLQKDIKLEVAEQEIKGVDPKQALRNSIERQLEGTVANEETKKTVLQLSCKMVDAIPSDEEKREVVTNQYIELFSQLLLGVVDKKLAIDMTQKHFTVIAGQIIELQKPVLRLELLNNLLMTFKEERDGYDSWVRSVEGKSPRLYIPLFLAMKMTKDQSVLDDLSKMISNRHFRNRIVLSQINSVLFSIYNTQLSQPFKEKAITQVIACYLKDLEIEAQKPKSVANPGNNIKKLRGQISAKKRLEKQKEQRLIQCGLELEGLRKQLEEEGDIGKKESIELDISRKIKQIEQLEKNRSEVLSQIQSLKSRVRAIPQKGDRDEHITCSVAEPAANKDSHAHLKQGQKILGMILSQGDIKFMESCLDQVGEGKRFSLLSDEKITDYVFTKAFGFGEMPQDASQKLGELSAPWALVTFHSRLKEVKGSGRNSILQTSKNVVDSFLKGTLWEDRHDEEGNPHLQQIFTAMPGLKEKWMNPPAGKKVVHLNPDATKVFANYEIVDAKDPSDIVRIGVDMNTCVHLQGRLCRVKGLLGFVRDGKIHTILAKDQEGNICAETQLQLMWDEKNQRPILFVEQVNFKGRSEKDYSLHTAMINYCKERARDLGLPLVSIYRCPDPDFELYHGNYSGEVHSLGSSSPVEYVNGFFENRTGPYQLKGTNGCYLVQGVA